MSLLRPRSLLARIMLAEVAAIAAVAVVLPLLLVSVLRDTTRRVQRETLTEQARSIAATVGRDGAGDWRVALPPPQLATYATRYDGRSYVVATARGEVLATSPYAGLAPWRAAPRGSAAAAFQQASFIGVSMPARVGGQPLWVIVTQDESKPGAIADDIVDAFLPRYSAVLLAALVVLPLIHFLLVRRLVVSVRVASGRAAEIGARTLDLRLDEDGLPSEVRPLVRALNDLLDRLQTSFARQTEFVGNVAHELRTPLATLRLRLETVADAALRGLLERQCERLAHVVAQLHDLASLELLAGEAMSAFDPAELVGEVVEGRAPVLAQSGHGLRLELPERPPAWRGNRFLLGVALANLIDNVARHTPAGTVATVSLREDGSAAVEDDGPGFAATDGLGPRRFWRADALRSDSAGLGLSIVRRIVEVHGGRMTIDNLAPRGARVVFRLGVEDGVAPGLTARTALRP